MVTKHTCGILNSSLSALKIATLSLSLPVSASQGRSDRLAPAAPSVNINLYWKLSFRVSPQRTPPISLEHVIAGAETTPGHVSQIKLGILNTGSYEISAMDPQLPLEEQRHVHRRLPKMVNALTRWSLRSPMARLKEANK